MFMPTIANQGTEEQKKLFLEPALKYEIIGCYAQTEVGSPTCSFYPLLTLRFYSLVMVPMYED